MTTPMAPIHPGDVLLAECLEPRGVSQHPPAVSIGVPPRHVYEVVRGKGRISADTALRLARCFGTSERFWINLQAGYDLELERDHLGPTLDAMEPLAVACPLPAHGGYHPATVFQRAPDLPGDLAPGRNP